MESTLVLKDNFANLRSGFLTAVGGTNCNATAETKHPLKINILLNNLFSVIKTTKSILKETTGSGISCKHIKKKKGFEHNQRAQ